MRIINKNTTQQNIKLKRELLQALKYLKFILHLVMDLLSANTCTVSIHLSQLEKEERVPGSHSEFRFIAILAWEGQKG